MTVAKSYDENKIISDNMAISFVFWGQFCGSWGYGPLRVWA